MAYRELTEICFSFVLSAQSLRGWCGRHRQPASVAVSGLAVSTRPAVTREFVPTIKARATASNRQTSSSATSSQGDRCPTQTCAAVREGHVVLHVTESREFWVITAVLDECRDERAVVPSQGFLAPENRRSASWICNYHGYRNVGHPDDRRAPHR
jgi:hypothetical protein